MTYEQILEQRPDLTEEMEERASIIMIDGNIPEDEAMELTAKRMHEKYIIIVQGELF